MKNLKVLVLGLIALVPLAATAQIDHRQHEQNKRIAQGIRHGSLTRAEAARLRAREAAIRARERRDRRDGHGLSRAERARIAREQSRLSKRIYEQKHNAHRRHRG